MCISPLELRSYICLSNADVCVPTNWEEFLFGGDCVVDSERALPLVVDKFRGGMFSPLELLRSGRPILHLPRRSPNSSACRMAAR